MTEPADTGAIWATRVAVGTVLVLNLQCALAFLFRPEAYAGSFELSGLPGSIAVRSFGILFLMWNSTYPAVIWRPTKQAGLFAIILIQQLIGVLGETWLWLQLPPEGYAALIETGRRFILFDAAGLVVMAAAYLVLWKSTHRRSA